MVSDPVGRNLVVCIGKSKAEVTANKRLHSRYCTIEANYRQTRKCDAASVQQESYFLGFSGPRLLYTSMLVTFRSVIGGQDSCLIFLFCISMLSRF